MKKFVITTVSVFCAAVVAFSLISAKNQNSEIIAENTNPANVSVVQVSNSKENTVSAEKVLEARFLNMLNHNFAYGEDLYYLESIVNRSVLALLDMKENDFVAEDYVSDYILNMYGISDINYSFINTALPTNDGYVYIAPCGYETYKHKMVSMTENEDGTYTVKTEVTVNCHDGESYTAECETLFARNEASQFGYNIIDSVITSNSVAM